MAAPPIRVLLLHEERLMFEGLSSLLADQGDLTVIGVATTADDAVDKAVHLPPDVVVMDTKVRDGSGIDACMRIREAQPDAAVLFLSAEAGVDWMTRAAGAGAAGYLSAGVPAKELVSAIRKLADGELLVAMATMARQSRDQAAGSAASGPAAGMTRRERDVLGLVAAGLTNGEIAARLGIEPRAVRAHVRSAIEKQGVHSRAQAVASARQAGLLATTADARG